MGGEKDSLEGAISFQDRYLIAGEVGVGSFGRVYRARQLSTGQDVALKVLQVRDLDTRADVENHRERFRREMRLCAELSHPHIVRLLDSGETVDGLLFAVFEFVPGTTLRGAIETEGRLQLADALQCMTQVLDALACAHAHGIVHRDLKPENIMLTKTGARRNAMVLDFGLAGFSPGMSNADAPRLTATREGMGTPSYAAPEQLRGEPATPRSDLYSWGLVLLECLTGEVVMSGRTAYEALMKQLGPEAVPVPSWLRDHRLGRLLATVTAKDSASRDVTAAAVLHALDDAQQWASVLAPSAPLGEGERRQVTVVAFGTVVTRLDGGAVDLEDVDQVERSQLALFARLAEEAGGTLARAQAGRVSVVFGYPRAREHDARRAVRVAVRAVAESRAASVAFEHGRGLCVHARAGIHSAVGIVRMEPPDSDGQLWCQIAGGPLVGALRLLERAAPDDVLITADTRVLLARETLCEPAGEIEVSERPEPLSIFRPTGDHAGTSLESFVERPETPLAGRASELARLTERWARAEGGAPGIVLLRGEAGIGKSRLVRELRRRVPPVSWLESHCIPEDQASPLRPVVHLLAGLSDPLDDLLATLGFDVPSTAPLLATLLGRPADERFPALRLSPERRKEMTLQTTCALFTRLGSRQPIVLVIEDVHWADPTTLELLQLLVDEVRGAEATGGRAPLRLLLVFTARPEFESPWGAGDASLVGLERLAVGDVERIVNAQWTGAGPAPADLVRRVAERTDGVPLFVEELLQVLVAPGGRLRDDRERPIPNTLRELLSARLDSLSAGAYESAQVAAALGREFPYELLLAVGRQEGKTEPMLRQDLRELLEARLLYRRSVADSYVFKHALVRDAAYESMVRPVRQRVHHRIVQAIRDSLPGLGEDRPEVLALHLDESGDPFTASEYWLRAGDRARRRAAYVEAILHLERGLAAIVSVPPSRERRLRELELLITLGTVHFSTKGYGAPEVGETFGRARELWGDLGTDASSLKIVTGLISMYLIRGDREATEALLPTCRALAEAENKVASLTGLTPLAAFAFWQGDHVRAREYLDRTRPLYRTEEFRRFAEDYGWDGGIFNYGYSVWNQWIMGDPDEAERTYRELLALAEASFDPNSLPLALGFGMAAAQGVRDVAETLARATRLVEISAEQRMYLWLAVGQCGLGWALARQGMTDEGIAQLRQGLDLYRLTGAMTPYAYYLAFLAEALQGAGATEDALVVVQEGLDLCESTLGRLPEPELLRIRGELEWARGNKAGAEECLQRAIELTRERQAHTWAIRTALSLGRLLGEQGRGEDARVILRAVVDGVPAGTRPPDLDVARAGLEA